MKFVKKDEILACEGDKDSTIFILIKGTIGIFKNNVEITRFSQKGTIIGEMSMILNSPRTATIIAVEDSYVATIKGSLEQIVNHFPDVASNIITNLAERLMNTTEGFCNVSEKLVDVMDVDSFDSNRSKDGEMRSLTDYMWFKTAEEKEIINVTKNVESVVAHSGIDDGMVSLFVMDNTSGLLITNENIKAAKDIEEFLYNSVSVNKTYNFKDGDMALQGAHIRKSLLQSDIVIPVTKGRLELSHSQNIYYIELNGKQRKRVTVKVLGI
ncbi:MAG: secondary thiamine-phosphate synthase enzyme YjbQ [Rhodothermaceae bacterium]